MNTKQKGAIIACSALKQSYRDVLTKGLENESKFVHLKGSFDEIWSRIKLRQGHYMPPALLQSQFDALEQSEEVMTIPVSLTTEQQLETILNQLSWKK